MPMVTNPPARLLRFPERALEHGEKAFGVRADGALGDADFSERPLTAALVYVRELSLEKTLLGCASCQRKRPSVGRPCFAAPT